jgi:hypothetical protein
MDTTSTRSVARRYFQAWTAGDGATVASLLADDYVMSAGPMRIEGRDAFLKAGSFPPDASVSMVAEAYEGDTGFQHYEASRKGRVVAIVERLSVRDEVIVASTIVTDQASYQAFLTA